LAATDGKEPNRVGYASNCSDVLATLSLMKLAGGNNHVQVSAPRNASAADIQAVLELGAVLN
jgi:hypothetical protein